MPGSIASTWRSCFPSNTPSTWQPGPCAGSSPRRACRQSTRRRPRAHRERMSQAGLLLQVDGSKHDWLEGRGPWLTLVGGIDDATGVVTGAVFREQEDARGYLVVLTQTALGHGVPLGAVLRSPWHLLEG